MVELESTNCYHATTSGAGLSSISSAAQGGYMFVCMYSNSRRNWLQHTGGIAVDTPAAVARLFFFSQRVPFSKLDFSSIPIISNGVLLPLHLDLPPGRGSCPSGRATSPFWLEGGTVAAMHQHGTFMVGGEKD